MPMTPWDEIVGVKCSECGKPASHYYGSIPICCQCHGGNIFTAEETAAAHGESGAVDTSKENE